MSDETTADVKKVCENCVGSKPGIIITGNNRACFKLWICDVHLMLPSLIQERAYMFRNRTVERVVVFGTITDVREFKTRVLYQVDDGSGHIDCIYNHNYMLSQKTKNIMDKFNGSISNKTEGSEHNRLGVTDGEVDSELCSAVKNSFSWLLKEVGRYKRKMKMMFDVGDTICVKGRINEFFGKREIIVYQLHIIDNLKDETNHILELVNLYKTEYKAFL